MDVVTDRVMSVSDVTQRKEEAGGLEVRERRKTGRLSWKSLGSSNIII